MTDDDELRRWLIARYPQRTRPIGFYPLPSTEVGPGELHADWRPYPALERRRGLVYLHVPFCRQRCSFCRFYPGGHTDQRATRFVDDARREIDLWAERRSRDPAAGAVEAVFVGGGTPSALATDQIEVLLRHLVAVFAVPPTAEITMEWYPKDAQPDKMAAARSAGVNRLSVGAQSWDEGLLRSLGAHHTPGDVDAVLAAAEAAALDNVNIDLMADGLKHDLSAHLADLRRAIAARPAMISVNLLELAAGSPLAHRRDEAAGDDKRRWLGAASATLAQSSYRHQRVRNYYRDGRLHRYNRASAGIAFDIVPVGPGAYGFLGGWPVTNAIAFDDWSERLAGGGDAVVGCAAPTDDEMRRAFVVNSLLELAIEGGEYQRLFATAVTDDFPALRELVAGGAFEAGEGGRLVLDATASEFADDISREVFSDFQHDAFDVHLKVRRTRRRSQYFPVVKA
jgi:coproporphyrinogen III oxidase-like Fe-S oxidoreductase